MQANNRPRHPPRPITLAFLAITLGWLTTAPAQGLNFLRKLIHWKLSTTSATTASTSSFPSNGALPTLKRPYILDIANWIKSTFPGWNKLSLPTQLFNPPPNQLAIAPPPDLDPSLISLLSTPGLWAIYLAPFQPGRPDNSFNFLLKDLSTYYTSARDGKLSYTALNGNRLSTILASLLSNPRVSLQLPDSIPDDQVKVILMDTINAAPIPFMDLLAFSALEATLRENVLLGRRTFLRQGTLPQ